jgi:predicted nucleic acid-binding protein
MKYLLDVNILVAWGWADHGDHERVTKWIESRITTRGDKLLTSAIPHIGFVRVSAQRSGGQVTPEVSGKVLAGLLGVLGNKHDFLPDDQEGITWPNWCQGASRTTDAHLLALATAHGAQLATLDSGIPGAFLLP